MTVVERIILYADAISKIENNFLSNWVFIFAVSLLPKYPPIIPPIIIIKISNTKFVPLEKSLKMYVMLLPVATKTTAKEETPVLVLKSVFVR